MKEIKAKEGMFLTQAKEVQDRIFVTAIKGMNVNEEDWREATQEEKEEYDNLKDNSGYEYEETDILIEEKTL